MASRSNPLFNPGAFPQAEYTNGVQVISSQWDFTILFFHAVPTPPAEPTGEPSLEQRQVQGVVMSPQHAKALALLLDKNIRLWEDQNSPITLPEEVVRGLSDGPESAGTGGPT